MIAWLEATREGLSLALIGLGLVFVFASAVGLLRFADFYTRIHAAKLAGVLGAPVVIVGLAALAFDVRLLLKLAVLAALIALLAPLAAHMLASAAHGAGLTPMSGPDHAKRSVK
jgi:multicomponent Na+:H+ antiporter subunit G